MFHFRQGNNNLKVIEHITDLSNATATGFYDPFTLTWADWAKQLFNVDVSINYIVLNSEFVATFKIHLTSTLCIGPKKASL
jgi:glycerol kinase